MIKNKRQVGGWRANKNGSVFENIIQYNANRTYWGCLRIPTGCKVLSMINGRPHVKLVKTPFDFMLFKDNKSIFFDAKTTTNKTFTYSMIDENQKNNLFSLHEEGQMAGYLINFANQNQTVFVDAGKLNDLKPGSSFSPEHGITLGSNQDILFDKLFTLS